MEDIKNNKYKIREASRVFDIPYSTLHDSVKKGISSSLERKPALSSDTEKLIVQTLIKLSDIVIGSSKYEIITVVSTYLINANKTDLFPGGIPGNKWYTLFKKRWNAVLSPR